MLRIRRLRLLFLGSFLLVATAAVIVTVWALSAQQNYAAAINLAGRQRMLIEGMTRDVLALQLGANPLYRQALSRSEILFEQTLTALAVGGAAAYTDGTTVTLPPSDDPDIRAQLQFVRATWNEMRPALRQVLENDPQSASFASAVTRVEQLAPMLLTQIDQVVRLYQAQAARNVTFVHLLQFSFLASELVLVIVVLTVTEQRVLKPLDQLRAAAQRIGAGDLDTPVVVTAPREIAELARSFDAMRRNLADACATLESWASELESRVAARVREIETLGKVAQAANRHAELAPLLAQVLPLLTERIGAAAAWVMLLDPRGDFTLAGTYNLPPALEEDDYGALRRSSCACQRKLLAGELTTAVNILECERLKCARGDTRGLRYHATVPLRVGEQSLGNLNLGTPADRLFDEDELRVLTALADQLGVTIERARLYEQVKAQRVQEQAALLDLSQALLGEGEAQRMMDLAVRAAAHALAVEFVALVLIDPDGSTFSPRAGVGWSPEQLQQTHRISLDASTGLGYAIRHRVPVLIPDERRETHFTARPWIEQMGIAASLRVPMLVTGTPSGGLVVYSRTVREWNAAEVRLLSLIANQTAVALEKARLFQLERRERENAAALLEITQIAGSSLELVPLLKHITRRTAQVCQVNRCTILLLDETGDYLLPVMSQYADGHPDPARWRTFTANSERVDAIPLFRDAIRERRPLELDQSACAALAALRWTQPFDIQQLLAVPLISHARVIGLMALDDVAAEHRFAPAQIELAQTIAGQVTSAITNAQLYAQVTARADELATLARVGQALSHAQSADETLQLILAEAVRLVNRAEGSIMLVEPETGTLRITSSIGLPLQVVRAFNDRRVRVDEGTFAHSIGRGEMVEAADTDADPRIVRDYTDTFPKQLTNVPLKTRRRVIGVIALDGLPHNDRDRRLLRALADLAAAAIEKANLFEAARRRAHQLHALHAASRALVSDLRPTAVLETLAETARRLTLARYAALGVVAADGHLAAFHTAGLDPEERQRIGAPPRGKGLLGALLREGAPIRLADLSRDPRAVGFPPNHPPMKTFMGVPIMARGKMLGGLYLAEKMNGQPFTLQDEQLVVSLAADAAIAIENARLFSQVQQLAITDDLTGLYNRRHLLELAEREFERARRYHRPLSALMVDLDHFKQVNDTLGHVVGDQVLRAVAARCQQCVRDLDLIGRYGGEEFLILLPEIDLEGARNVAERLLQRAAATPIEARSCAVEVTISLGIAGLTEDCPDLTALIQWADRALYVAKAAGRNCAREFDGA